MSRLRLSPDLLLRLGPGGELLLYHVRARSHLELGEGALALLRAVAAGVAEEALQAALGGRPLRLRELTREGTLEGLFADPTNLDSAALARPLGEADELGLDAAIELLLGALVLLRDDAAYQDRLGLKQGEGEDRERLGNYYQHLTEQLARRELAPERWWVEQKFEAGLRGLRPSPYEHVQHRYLRESFPPGSLEGKLVLDLGCGPGFYAGFFADRGAEVLGLDPSREHVRAARARFGAPGCRFKLLRLRKGRILPLTPRRFDLIWISDTLLFYFALPHLIPIRQALLSRLRELLAPAGELVVMDPHGAFWLAPWFGDQRDPFTVLAEYGPTVAERRFRPVPTLAELAGALTSAGFVIHRIEEPGPARGLEAVDERGYHFARRFPLWWVLRARAAPQAR